MVNWPLSRLILSVSANIYTRIVTGMPLHDATGGFKCFRREVLEALPLDRIKSDGYSFQIEMNFHVWKRRFRIVEMPIVFTDRLVGAVEDVTPHHLGGGLHGVEAALRLDATKDPVARARLRHHRHLQQLRA